METLSISMIIKDEPIERLVMLIDFMLPLLHRFVIADTGSKDFEIDRPLLEKAGATVIQTPWTNDFAAARNSTLPYLESDWTLHLDADEFCSYSMMFYIEGVLYDSNPATMGFTFMTQNWWGGEKGIMVPEHRHCRLFRTAHGAWYRKIHELVQLDGKPESQTRGTIVLVDAPDDAILIHSKGKEAIEKSASLYREIES